jgi:glycerophosphoryl diester phosphodiesterase
VKRWLKTLGMAGAVLFLVLTVVNASWLAPEPKGAAKIIAHRGISQQYDKTGLGRDDCTATRIEQPVHDYLENTTRSIARTAKLGATLVEVDIAPTSDGEMAVFHDWTVDCRTQASGDTRDFALEELKALDAGYGYTADGGESFPSVGARIVVLGPQGEGRPRGLDLPEQLGEIPASFNGYVMVDDSLAVIPALIQRFDDRTPEEFERLQGGLERRRARRGD